MSIGLSTGSAPAGNGALLRRLIGPVVLPNRFALTDGMNMVRIIAGLFYLPHVIQKLAGIDSSLVFFTKAGLVPAPLFLGLSITFESLSFICLTFGLFTRWIGLVSFGCMMVAAYAIIQTKGLGWYWARGGVEYLLFWGFTSLVIAIDAWRKGQALAR
ncbi:DoxX family protein [Azorhizobium doebereinerae]|uniref:DoxX family protein n=1 Tax=Azorhizobium doebereinerae TaxID=281091 RepID=UPI0004153F8B|nr:DoxX family protein [Azorhizobium doebereinerae]